MRVATQLIQVLVVGHEPESVRCLADMLTALADQAGWQVHSTQTGIASHGCGPADLYLEMAIDQDNSQELMLALQPTPGEVDVVIATGLVDLSRALQAGLITPERTRVVTSLERRFSITERMKPGDGRVDHDDLIGALQAQARRLIMADMSALAQPVEAPAAIALLAGVAVSQALPWSADDYRAMLKGLGPHPERWVAAFDSAMGQLGDAACTLPPKLVRKAPLRALPDITFNPDIDALLNRIRHDFPEPAWGWLGEGAARVLDWQDVRYGHEYLDRVARFTDQDDAFQGWSLSIEAARWVAVAMSYDDLIRVADLKARLERSVRLRLEVGADPDDGFQTEEYFHPRMEDITGMLPLRLARWLDDSPALRGWLAQRLEGSWRLNSQSLRGHLQLRLMAGMRRWRRINRRHAEEIRHLEHWLKVAEQARTMDYHLGVEVLRCRQLVKGYSDTHARGTSRFDKVLRAVSLLQWHKDPAKAVADLRRAALEDAEGIEFARTWQALGLPG